MSSQSPDRRHLLRAAILALTTDPKRVNDLLTALENEAGHEALRYAAHIVSVHAQDAEDAHYPPERAAVAVQALRQAERALRLSDWEIGRKYT